MILLADSGSTKCDWILLDNGEIIVECHTMGFNPYFHSEDDIVVNLREKTELMAHANKVRNVFFFGAGCSSEELNAIVRRGLHAIFDRANIRIGHDLEGAALATYQGEPHIACILGTGSNSCFFDGQNLSEAVPALAYILGDEGSGSYYGKRMLADLLYKKMPEHLASEFAETFQLDKHTIFENVYMKPHANVYLASFMRFASRHKDEPYIRNMIAKGMRHFLNVHVECYPNHKEIQVNFIGSIAYYFEDLLRQAATERGIHVGRIVKKPIHGLVDYHRKYSFSKAAN